MRRARQLDASWPRLREDGPHGHCEALRHTAMLEHLARRPPRGPGAQIKRRPNAGRASASSTTFPLPAQAHAPPAGPVAPIPLPQRPWVKTLGPCGPEIARGAMSLNHCDHAPHGGARVGSHAACVLLTLAPHAERAHPRRGAGFRLRGPGSPDAGAELPFPDTGPRAVLNSQRHTKQCVQQVARACSACGCRRGQCECRCGGGATRRHGVGGVDRRYKDGALGAAAKRNHTARC